MKKFSSFIFLIKKNRMAWLLRDARMKAEKPGRGLVQDLSVT